MQKNQLPQSLWLLLLVLGCLLSASLLPNITIGSLPLKKINLLADIQVDPEKLIVDSTMALVPDTLPDASLTEPKPTKEEPPDYACPKGITCLEDFSETKSVLKNFFKALKKVKSEPVRIAFYGDSFIEGDVLCGSFRDTLQAVYGGRGVGYVPVASEVTQYRVSVQHTFSNWKTYSLVGKNKDTMPPLGIAGYAFVPLADNEVEYKPGRRQKPRLFNDIKVFYQSKGAVSMQYSFNDTSHFAVDLLKADSLQQISLTAPGIQSVNLRFTNPDSVTLYGVSFEDNHGVYVDNFAMRGNSGMGLADLPATLMKEFNYHQDYKLILLQYGLNMITETDSMDYTWYQARMVNVINRLKEIFPTAGIILIGISDRGGNIDGEIKTLPAVPRMRNAQHEIARKTKIAFWDLYAAMGGENTMVNYVAAQPPLAAKDYTHLTFKGGQKIAKKLADAILFEQNRYDKKSVNP